MHIVNLMILLLFLWKNLSKKSHIGSFCYQSHLIAICVYLICINFNCVKSSLIIGAIFPYAQEKNFTDKEIVFKHATYVSNQYKLKFQNTITNYPTLLHKIISISEEDHLKNMKKICKETNGNMLAYIGYSNDISHLYTNSISQNLDIIYMNTSPNELNSNTFSIYPDLSVLCRAYASLMQLFAWKHTAIIYDTEYNDMNKLKCILAGPSQDLPKLDVVLKLAKEGDDYRSILKDLIKRKITNIIIDLSADKAELCLRMCLQLGMINSQYNFVLTTLDIENMSLEDYKYNRANITAFRLLKTNSSFYKDISLNLIDFNSNSGVNSNKNKILSYTENALFFDAVFSIAFAIKEAEKTIDLNIGNVSCLENKSLKYGRLIEAFVEKTSVNGLTGHIKFQNKRRSDFDLDIMQLREVGLVETGTWSSRHGLNYTFYEEIYEEIVTSKKILRVATLIEEPYVMERPDGEFEGFCIDILKEIAKKMNFKFEIYKAPDNRYGSELPNGSWDGVVRELIEKRADLGVSSLTINYKRQQVVDFTKPYISLGISILFKVPTSEKPGLFSFLSPLSLQIWMYTLMAYLAVSFILMALARFSPYEWHNPHPCNTDSDLLENNFTVSNSLWFAVGTLMQQGSDINPKALSTRLVGGVWWFFTLIIISSYTANLAAFLTVERVVLPIQSVEDLVNQQTIQYGTLIGGSTMSFFKESTVDVYKRIWKQMESSQQNFVQSTEEGIQRVLKKNYAFFMESTMIDYNVQKNCNLTQIGGLLDSKGYGIAAQRGSPYTDEISLKLLEMQEKGIIMQLYNKWWKGNGGCVKDEKKDSKANALGVQNVGGIFVVLVGGLILAIIVSICEFSYYAKKNSLNSEKSLCAKMAKELRFAMRCGGSKKRRIETPCEKCVLSKTASNPSIRLTSANKSDECCTHEQQKVSNLKHKTNGLLVLDNVKPNQQQRSSSADSNAQLKRQKFKEKNKILFSTSSPAAAASSVKTTHDDFMFDDDDNYLSILKHKTKHLH